MEVACERLIIRIGPRAFLVPAHDRNGADRPQRVGLVQERADSLQLKDGAEKRF